MEERKLVVKPVQSEQHLGPMKDNQITLIMELKEHCPSQVPADRSQTSFSAHFAVQFPPAPSQDLPLPFPLHKHKVNTDFKEKSQAINIHVVTCKVFFLVKSTCLCVWPELILSKFCFKCLGKYFFLYMIFIAFTKGIRFIHLYQFLRDAHYTVSQAR